MNLGSNVGSAVTMILAGRVLYAPCPAGGSFSILGNSLGAGLAIKKGAPFIRVLLLAVLAMLLAALGWDVVQEIL